MKRAIWPSVAVPILFRNKVNWFCIRIGQIRVSVFYEKATNRFELLILGGVPQSFEVQFLSGFTPVFTQVLTISQVTDISQVVGASGGPPHFRLLLDLETNPSLPVSDD